MATKLQAQTKPKAAVGVSPALEHKASPQRKCACGQHTTAGACPECRKEAPGLERKVVDQSALASVPPIVAEVLRSPGEPLDPDVRDDMEQRFGHDFSRVRVHSHSPISETATALGAEAYTVGTSVIFSPSSYAPRNRRGRLLLAHELSHVVQQSEAAASDSRSVPNSLLERAADGAAERVLANESVGDLGSSPFRLQRKPTTGDQYTIIFNANRYWQRKLNPTKARSSNHWPFLDQLHDLWWSNNPDRDEGAPHRFKAFIDAVWQFQWEHKEQLGNLVDGIKSGTANGELTPRTAALWRTLDEKVKQEEKAKAEPTEKEVQPVPEPKEETLLGRVKKRMRGLPANAKWKGNRGRTYTAINLLIVARDFWFNEPIDQEFARKIIRQVNKVFVQVYLTDSNFDKKFGSLSGFTRTPARMLLIGARSAVERLRQFTTPGLEQSEASWKHEINYFMAGHEVMEVLADDLALQAAKGLQSVESIMTAKALTAFFDGLLAGAKSQLSEDDLKTLNQKVAESQALSAVAPPVILAGAAVGIAKDIADALKGIYELVTDPEEVVSNMINLIETLIFDEEGARSLGEALGAEKGKAIHKLTEYNTVRFTYELGVLVGPTVVYAVLSLTGVGAAASTAVSTRLAGFLKRFPKTAKFVERIENLLPSKKTLEAAEEGAAAKALPKQRVAPTPEPRRRVKPESGRARRKPPSDPYDVEAWQKYYEENPDVGRSVGAAAADDPAVSGAGKRPRSVYPEFDDVSPGLKGTATAQVKQLSSQLGIPVPEDRVLSAPWIGRVYGKSGKTRSVSTSQGWLRSEGKFWKKWKEAFPDDAKLLGTGNTVTAELAKKYGWPDSVVGDKLVHHHIANSHLAVAIPESLHKKLSGAIHAKATVVGQ